MRILVTGSSGFVGRNIITELCQRKDFEILFPNSTDLNLLSETSVAKWLNKNTVDLFIHAAGLVGGIQANIADQVGFLVNNADMARNLFLGASRVGLQSGINLASSCMYPVCGSGKLSEEFLMQGSLEPTNRGYAFGKLYALQLAELLTNSTEIEIKTLIPCNLFGRFDSYDPLRSHMIAAAIHKTHNAKCASDDSVVIWGEGRARREFMDIRDLINCIVKAIDDYDTLPHVMNVGTGKDYTVLEYYKLISEVVGFTGDFTFDHFEPEGILQKCLDVSRAAEWGWVAEHTVKEGLEYTYKLFLDEIGNGK